ncbi:MAG: 4Fe-4S binding protein [Eggerthellaceae bacterium]|nr:4Fe-4S binding protein [Eggerthellaceae bacterium]
MPNLIDIVEIAESLESKAIFEALDRCVVVRNRNVKCRKCAKACSVGAISIQNNKLELDHHICVGCGACTVVCPTEALIPLQPFDEELHAAITEACLATEGIALFACARIAAKKLVHPTHFAEVSCLARVDESVLLAVAAHEVSRILLIEGNCTTCKYRDCMKGFDETVSSANALLEAVGSELRVERTSEFPQEFLAEDASRIYGAARREFFTKARGGAKDVTGKTVALMLKGEKDEKPQSPQQRLKVSAAGTLPQFEAKRRMKILDAMDRMGGLRVPEIETRLWGNVTIDLDKCNSCRICTTFCPTGALHKIETEKDGEKKFDIEFSVADCVQCKTCVDICIKRCIEVDSLVSAEELFDFEPRFIAIPIPQKKQNVLDGLHR